MIGCIDKSSSAELSEAINSMYRWYRNSTSCCIYLADVSYQPEKYYLPATRLKFAQAVKNSRWLTRGWTLQELLAPRNRFFYSMNWEAVGFDILVIRPISEETGISLEAFYDFKPERWSIAQKMSWAARRQTTRMEDRAYSLLGIFNVNMPLIYGEGESAFRRLQEEVLKYSTDQTIFCWRSTNANYATWRGLFARSPSEFADSGDILENKRVNALPFQLTNKDIQLSLELVPGKWNATALLQCYDAKSLRQCGIYLQRTHYDNYVRVESDELAAAADISVPLVRNKTKTFETLFAKPEVVGMTWRKLDMCPWIAGFRFVQIADDPYQVDPCKLWYISITETTQNHQCVEGEGMFLFDFEHDDNSPGAAVARCRLDSASECSIEILVKHDWRKKYGEGDDVIQRRRKDDDTAKSDWVQSECCEWKIEGSSCNKFEISATSWIELDDESDTRIHVQFSDSGDHCICDLEEWECSEDAVQNELEDAAGCFNTFPVQALQD
jgi:hypothetical protein